MKAIQKSKRLIKYIGANLRESQHDAPKANKSCSAEHIGINEGLPNMSIPSRDREGQPLLLRPWRIVSTMSPKFAIVHFLLRLKEEVKILLGVHNGF